METKQGPEMALLGLSGYPGDAGWSQMQLQETVDSASSTSSPYRVMSLGWTLNAKTRLQVCGLML